MGAHILLVGADNFDICIERGVYGCVLPAKEWNQAEVVAGISSMQRGDLIFFYVKNRGVYGLWQVAGVPFFDTVKIWRDDTQIFPYRFTFEPIVGNFPSPVTLNDVLELRDQGLIWTFDLNPVQQKNQYKITMAEAEKLLRLLLRNNSLRTLPREINKPYAVPDTAHEIEIDLTSDRNGKIKYEGWLNAWFMKSFSFGKLSHIFGGYNEFINLVPTTYNKVMDIFLTHSERIGSVDVMYKYTCIELKADRADEEDLAQLLRYEKWLAQKLASGDFDMIQSVLVAHRFTNEVLDYVKRRNDIEAKKVKMIKYELDGQPLDVFLEELQ